MSIQEILIQKYQSGVERECADYLAVEEPLEMNIHFFKDNILSKKTISITMRTSGHDKELTLGFLVTEGLLSHRSQVDGIEQISENQVLVFVKKEIELNLDKFERNFYTTSSCGVCGKSSLDAIRVISSPQNETMPPLMDEKVILSLHNQLSHHQSNFSQTGGIHASALFDLKGRLNVVFEDVGRQNALDKLIGHVVINGETSLSSRSLNIV